jgi:hypothetical protein
LVLALAFYYNIRVQADNRTAELRKSYQDCIFGAAGSQAKHHRVEATSSEATVLGFQACQAEEQAILAHLYAAGVTPVTANKALTAFKLKLKQTVGKVSASPQ